MSCNLEYEYYVVQFPNEEVDGSCPIGVISSRWTFEENGSRFCWWPNFKTDKARLNAVKRHDEVGPHNGSMCEIELRYKTDDFERAQKKVRQLEVTSDIESDYSKSRQKGNNTQKYEDYHLNISSESEDLPEIPIFEATKKGSKKTLRTKQNSGSEAHQGSQTRGEEMTQQSNNCDCYQLKKTLEELCRFQQKMAAEVNERLDMLTLMVSQGAAASNSVDSTPRFTSTITVLSFEELENLEQKLKEETEYQKFLHVLKRVGGRNYADTTRRVMAQLIDHKVAVQCNWTGRNSKPAFSSFQRVIKLIEDAVMANPLSGSEATTSSIQNIIKSWLRGASDREGGRSNRKKEIA